MCMVCVDWNKGNLTAREALKNLGELVNADDGEKDHYWKLIDEIVESELQTDG